MHKDFSWNVLKNEWLIAERDISFEEILSLIDRGCLSHILEHSNQAKYLNQKVFVIHGNVQVYLVPFVEDETRLFLKTIFPSRKAKKLYPMNGGSNEINN